MYTIRLQSPAQHRAERRHILVASAEVGAHRGLRRRRVATQYRRGDPPVVGVAVEPAFRGEKGAQLQPEDGYPQPLDEQGGKGIAGMLDDERVIAPVGGVVAIDFAPCCGSVQLVLDALEFGARIAYAFSEARYELALFGRNLTDEEIVQNGIDFNNLTGMMNDPRTFGLEFVIRF